MRTSLFAAVIAGTLATLGGAATASAKDLDVSPASVAARATPTVSLDAVTAGDLLILREEEKLARDVYITLGEKWGLTIFANIKLSEQTHTDQIKALLAAYGLPDPAAGKGVGEFTNEHIAELYASLVTQGLASPADALVVGATIEDLDIFDLMEAAKRTKVVRVLKVYANLTRGSRNHLRSFVGNLDAIGVDYQPQFISQELFDTILATPMETP